MWKQQSFLNEFYFSQSMVLKATKNHSFIVSLPRLFFEMIALIGLTVMIMIMLNFDKKINNILSILLIWQ